jgi:hypothetical protein
MSDYRRQLEMWDREQRLKKRLAIGAVVVAVAVTLWALATVTGIL